MTAPAAIMGSLVDAKNVHTHKSLRLIIDVPAEHAQKVFEAFGWPTMANPVSVAVARLTDSAAVAADHKTAGVGSPVQGGAASPDIGGARPGAASPASERKPLALASRIALTCELDGFTDWLRSEPAYRKTLLEEYDRLSAGGLLVSSQDANEAVVKRLCGVERKRDILPGTPAADRWADIWFQFTHSGQGRAA